MSGVPRSRDLFDLVFFIVVVGAFLPGATVPWISRRLGVESTETDSSPPIIAMRPPAGDMQLRSFQIEPTVAVAGAALSTIPMPAGSAITVIDRGGTLMAPTPDWVLEDGDGVYVLYRRDDAAHIELLFGPATED
jgi:cell volume regulation protein A